VIFQKKRTDWILETSTWRSGQCYLDHKGMNLALIYMIEMIGVRRSEMSTEKVLMLDHQRMGHHFFNFLSRLYTSLFKK
jgi:hypothetical protein